MSVQIKNENINKLNDLFVAREEILSCIVYLPSGVYGCEKCDYTNPTKSVMYKHVDSKHMDFIYNCVYCGKENPTQHSMDMHIRRTHKNIQHEWWVINIFFRTRSNWNVYGSTSKQSVGLHKMWLCSSSEKECVPTRRQ